jgi:hypothetical protein
MLLPATDPTRWPNVRGIPEHVMMFLDLVAYRPMTFW